MNLQGNQGSSLALFRLAEYGSPMNLQGNQRDVQKVFGSAPCRKTTNLQSIQRNKRLIIILQVKKYMEEKYEPERLQNYQKPVRLSLHSRKRQKISSICIQQKRGLCHCNGYTVRTKIKMCIRQKNALCRYIAEIVQRNVHCVPSEGAQESAVRLRGFRLGGFTNKQFG